MQFKKLTGNEPFPWQKALYESFISSRPDNIPASCNLPTGVGKTAVVAIWLLARLHRPSRVPRRLVYVVNRRTVVDQTTLEAEKLRDNLRTLNAKVGELAISTLRGQYADNREWSEDPARLAVICGTVDMIGSALLFSGYGCGFKTKPLRAGFLGQDALLVHDEAHLEPAFQKLVLAIEKEQRRCGDLLPLRVMELSATSRSEAGTFTLSAADESHKTVKRRILAAKKLKLHPAEEKSTAERLIELALAHVESQQAILVFVRTIEDLAKVTTSLPRAQQLTGTMRGLERERLLDSPVFNRFLPDSNRRKNVVPAVGTVYLVCTSAGEVGVNISADHLVCDLTPLDSMAQRFGRVNRFGNPETARIDIVHPKDFGKRDPSERARENTLRLLTSIAADASPARIGKLIGALSPDERKAAFSPEPVILSTSEILFDAWALTTIRDYLPGRPRVAEYLHGVSESEPPQTCVAWRSEVAKLSRSTNNDSERSEFASFVAALIEDYPLKQHELLRDRTSRVHDSLKGLIAPRDTPIWILDEGHVFCSTLNDVIETGPGALADRTLLLPPQAGGLRFDRNGDSTGLFAASAAYDPDRAGVYDVADEWRDKQGALRQRQEQEAPRPAGMRLERAIAIPQADGDDSDSQRMWYWFVRTSAAEANERNVSDYSLEQHLLDAAEQARRMVDRLNLRADLGDAVILATQLHDIGKDRERWQRGIGNLDYPRRILAKSSKRTAAMERTTYRHEFGSLLDIGRRTEFMRLSEESQELVLHLVAAHHGRARPHFPLDESFDDRYLGEETRTLAAAIPLRFARLQRRFGRWGLAYLESLVRAADQRATVLAAQADEPS